MEGQVSAGWVWVFYDVKGPLRRTMDGGKLGRISSKKWWREPMDSSNRKGFRLLSPGH